MYRNGVRRQWRFVLKDYQALERANIPKGRGDLAHFYPGSEGLKNAA